MRVGRFNGVAVDKIPNGYLRWMVTQTGFPKDVLECAKDKLEKSNFCDLQLSVSRHAIDEFSLRFNRIWLNHVRDSGNEADGMATFITKMAQEALDYGEDRSKRRHQDDGTIKEYKQIKWVFAKEGAFPEYKELVTVMPVY